MWSRKKLGEEEEYQKKNKRVGGNFVKEALPRGLVNLSLQPGVSSGALPDLDV